MPPAIPGNALLVDTGFLVALFRRRDRLRAAARNFLVTSKAPLVTVAPVIVETCFFLDAEEKQNLLEWLKRGAVGVREVPVDAYPKISWLIGKYADRDPDFTDMALLWLAQTGACRQVLTVDITDFSIYRGKAGKALDLPRWMN